MSESQLLSLATIEKQLKVSRTELLVAIKKLKLEPIRRGMRTWINEEQIDIIKKHFNESNIEIIPAKSIDAEWIESTQVEKVGIINAIENNEYLQFEIFRKIRLVREKAELFELLERTGFLISTKEMCQILEIKKPPVCNINDEQGSGFSRNGILFKKVKRNGERLLWKVVKS